MNSEAIGHINGSMEYLLELKNYLDDMVDIIFRKWVEIGENNGEMHLVIKAGLINEHPILQKETIHRSLIICSGREKNISKIHSNLVINLLNLQMGRYLMLPYHMIAKRVYDGISIKCQSLEQRNFDYIKFECGNEVRNYIKRTSIEPRKSDNDSLNSEVIHWDFPTLTDTKRVETTHQRFGLKVTATLLNNDEFTLINMEKQLTNQGEINYTKYFDYDIIGSRLTMRTRQPGDFITINQKGNRQKLRSYFINEKVPSDIRSQFPY